MAIVWCVLAARSILGPEPAGASLPTPEKYRLPFTVGQAAALMVARYELIVEAEVRSVEAIQIGQPAGHRWVSELWLQPIRQLWGQIDDPTFKVITESVLPEQEAQIPPGTGGVMHGFDVAPPPRVGERGIFLLTTQYDLVQGVPWLFSTRCGFAPKRADGNTSVCIIDLSYTWPYEEVVTAIARRVEELSIESLAPQADAIFVGKLGGDRGRVVDVDVVYRGHPPDPFSFFLAMDLRDSDPQLLTQGMLAGEVAMLMSRCDKGRALVLTRKQAGLWLPVGPGLFKIAGNRVRLERRVHGGKLGWSEIPLVDLEPVLTGKPRPALPAPQP